MKILQNLEYREAWRAVRHLFNKKQIEHAALNFGIRCGEMMICNEDNKNNGETFYIVEGGAILWDKLDYKELASVTIFERCFDVMISEE